MQRLRRIEALEIARVVGDENKVAVAGVTRDIPVFPAGLAYMRDVLGVMAACPATETKSTVRHSSIRNLTTPQWCRPSGAPGARASDRARAADAVFRVMGTPRHKPKPGGSSRR